MRISHHIEHFTHSFAKGAGTSRGFGLALFSIMIWFVVGAFVGFTSHWREWLVLYVEVITFLMIFLMQRGENKELAALHVKLNELIAVNRKADNRLINAEEMTEQEISDVQETHGKIKKENSDNCN